MTDLCLSGDPWPFAPTLLKHLADFDIEACLHPRTIAKHCDVCKQHIANPEKHTFGMSTKPVNQRIAEALNDFMGTKWNNVQLANASGVAESTIRNYRNPEKRQQGASGKAPSAKATELEALATALGLDVADLVTDMSPDERLALHRRRAADYYAQHGSLPAWAPDTPNGKALRQAA